MLVISDDKIIIVDASNFDPRHSTFSGTVIWENSKYHKVGYYSDNWASQYFTIYDISLKLIKIL